MCLCAHACVCMSFPLSQNQGSLILLANFGKNCTLSWASEVQESLKLFLIFLVGLICWIKESLWAIFNELDAEDNVRKNGLDVPSILVR